MMFRADDTVSDGDLRSRLKSILLPVEVMDGSDVPVKPGQRPASVMMPLIHRDEWQVLFTRRPLYMPSHAGQISFPGGRTEAGETPCQGVSRETFEEIGVGPEHVDIVGRLPSFNAVSNYRVTPFVGILDNRAEITPCPQEVEEVFELPLAFFMDEANHVAREVDYEGRRFTMYDMPWPDQHTVQYKIWGMTAMVVYQVVQGLKSEA